MLSSGFMFYGGWTFRKTLIALLPSDGTTIRSGSWTIFMDSHFYFNISFYLTFSLSAEEVYWIIYESSCFVFNICTNFITVDSFYHFIQHAMVFLNSKYFNDTIQDRIKTTTSLNYVKKGLHHFNHNTRQTVITPKKENSIPKVRKKKTMI